MCGRFAQFNPLDILKARFEIETVTAIPAPSYNIAPTREVPVLIDHQGLRLGIMKWGFTFSHAPKDRKPGLIINARAETLGEKKTFREAFARRRCLILADGFYEWKQEGKTKIPFYFPPGQTTLRLRGTVANHPKGRWLIHRRVCHHHPKRRRPHPGRS
jgi:putative SOS response-associated peptidase YedK